MTFMKLPSPQLANLFTTHLSSHFAQQRTLVAPMAAAPRSLLLSRGSSSVLSSGSICAACLRRTHAPTPTPATSLPRRAFLNRQAHLPRHSRFSTASPRQARPKDDTVDDFYALLLSDPLPTSARTTRQGPSPPPPSSTAPSPPPSSTSSATPNAASAAATAAKETSDVAARAAAVFGSRLTDPKDRAARAAARAASATMVAGIRVPPRPAEPDNCCMSGCVNCVWDLYREELEEWADARREAEGAARRLEMKGGSGSGEVSAASSMDDDGGGVEANWGPEDEDALRPGSESTLFTGVPVGIKEFMRIEKRLGRRRKEREEKEMAGVGGGVADVV